MPTTQSQLNQLGKDIINNNIYMTLATYGDIPWAAPVYYCTDQDYNFYFISQPNSLHSQHIQHLHQAAFSIFDSHQPEGTGNGIQGIGTVILLKEKDIPQALKYYQTTFITLTPTSLQPPNPYRLYKLTPSQIYVLDPDSDTDARAKITV